MFGAQRVDDCAAIDFGWAAAVGRQGDDQRRESGPRFIGQIGRIVRWIRIEAHGAASPIAPHQNGMVAIMIPQIRFSDRPLRNPVDAGCTPGVRLSNRIISHVLLQEGHITTAT